MSIKFRVLLELRDFICFHCMFFSLFMEFTFILLPVAWPCEFAAIEAEDVSSV